MSERRSGGAHAKKTPRKVKIVRGVALGAVLVVMAAALFLALRGKEPQPPSGVKDPVTNNGTGDTNKGGDEAPPVEELNAVTKPITDVRETDDFYEAFTSAKSAGALADIPFDGVFGGGSAMSRGMLAMMVYNLYGEGKASASLPTDVGKDEYYSAAAGWAAETGLLPCDENGAFRPEEAVTREAMMTLAARLAKRRGAEAELGSDRYILVYADRGEVSDWALEDVRWCVQEGVLAAKADGVLAPQETLNRGAAVQALCEMEQWFQNGTTRPVVSAEAVVLDTEEHAALQAEIDAIAKRYWSVGLSVAYIENGAVADTFAYGAAIKGSVPMTADTKIRIASLSKVWVGLATMLSVERGVMELDGDIGNYWGFPIGTHAKGDVITPRVLLTHTSSISNNDSVAATYHDAMASILRSGSGIRGIVSGNIGYWSYNNYAIDVLGITVELANQRELDDILGEYLYGPLSIDAAFYGGDLQNTDLLGNIYRSDGSVGRSAAASREMHSDGVPGSYGSSFAGGLVTSAYDMGKVVALLAGDGVYDGVRYLPASVVENMEYHEGNELAEFSQAQPLRYRTDAYGQSALYYHTGSAYGVYNLMCYNPDTGKGVVVLTSGASAAKDQYGIYAVCGAIAQLLMGENA